LVWFEIMTNFQNETKNIAKFVHFQKKLVSPNLIVKKWHIGATINKIDKKIQNISFENSFLRKHVFRGKKTPKRIIVLKAK